jgi:inorganic pyrophosphatase
VEFDVIVEVPMGSRNKYETDLTTGRIRLDRTLLTATRYPADYGYIPDTLTEDGDPLDCVVLVEEPTFPGCLVRARPVGVFWIQDEKGRDSKILAVPTNNLRQSWTDIGQLPRHLLLEISHFFAIYKELEPGKSSEVHGWDGHLEAEREIEQAGQRHRAGATA